MKINDETFWVLQLKEGSYAEPLGYLYPGAVIRNESRASKYITLMHIVFADRAFVILVSPGQIHVSVSFRAGRFFAIVVVVEFTTYASYFGLLFASFNKRRNTRFVIREVNETMVIRVAEEG